MLSRKLDNLQQSRLTGSHFIFINNVDGKINRRIDKWKFVSFKWNLGNVLTQLRNKLPVTR